MDSVKWCIPLWIVVCLRVDETFGQARQNIYVSGCNNETLHLNCPSKHKIAIKRVFYGAKEDRACARLGRKLSPGCCERVQADCVEHDSDVYTILNSRCSGDTDCHYDITPIRTTDACNISKTAKPKMTDFMTVVYDCVPNSDIAQFCSNDVKKGKLLYVSNLNYPDSIRGGRQFCQCFIKTAFSRGIAINVIDIMLTYPAETDQCPQQIRITDTYRTRSYSCGQRGMFGFRNIYTRMVSNVTVVLDSNAEAKRGYAWMQVKSQSLDDFVMIYCGSAMDKLLYGAVTTPDASNITAVAPASLQPKIIPDMIAIIGGVAGAVALVLIICIVAIAVHCTRERERMAYPKVPEVIPSPMVRGKVYHPEGKDATHQRYNYDEDRYCSIKRSPMKMTKLSDVDSDDADQKLKEAFLQMNEHNPHQYSNGRVKGVVPVQRNPETRLLLDPPTDYKSVDKPGGKFFTMNTQKPQTEVAEIRVTSSLPQRGKVKKQKTVTFSPVAMVTPLPSGSEESIGSEGDRNLANIIDTYQNLRDDKITSALEKNNGALIAPANNSAGFASIEGPNEVEIAEMEELWKSLGDVGDSTTMDDGAYDNIDYLLAQNRAKHNDMI